MANQIKGKYIQNAAIDGTKLLLKNNDGLRSLKSDGDTEVLLKLDSSDKLILLKVPEVSADASTDNGLVRKSQLEAKISNYVTDKLGAANGIATLGSDGKIPSAQLPSLAISNVSVVPDVAARDALTVETGDVAKVTFAATTGLAKTYIYDGSDWIEIKAGGDVDSVNGYVGTVVLTAADVKLASDSSKSVEAKLSDLQSEVDATQTGAGLESDGSYAANSASVYLTSATSLKDADEKLDAAIDALQGQVDGVQGELDATQTGAGLEADGSYSANSTAAYISMATSLKDADEKLAAAIQSLQSEVNATQAGAGLESDGSYSSHAGSNFLKAADFAALGLTPSLHNADKLLDAAIAAIQVTINNLSPQLDGLSDVAVSNKVDEDLLQWDSTTSKWVNASPLSEGALSYAAIKQVLVGSEADYYEQLRGLALSSDGTTAVFGATYESTSPTYQQGAVWVFRKDSSGALVQEAKLIPSSPVNYEQFGISAAINSDGTVVVVGAQGINSQSGAVYVFTKTGSSWSETAVIVPDSPAGGSYFGSSVAVSSDGGTILAGAYNRTAATYNQSGAIQSYNWSNGGAFVFKKTGSSYSQQADLTDLGMPQNYQQFGWSVSLSSDGNTAVVGAPARDENGMYDNGAAFVFKRSGQIWSRFKELMPDVPAYYESFGYSVGVSASGNSIVVGARNSNTPGYYYSGSAYVFQFSSDATVVSTLYSRSGSTVSTGPAAMGTTLKAQAADKITKFSLYLGRTGSTPADTTIQAKIYEISQLEANSYNGDSFDLASKTPIAVSTNSISTNDLPADGQTPALQEFNFNQVQLTNGSYYMILAEVEGLTGTLSCLIDWGSFGDVHLKQTTGSAIFGLSNLAMVCSVSGLKGAGYSQEQQLTASADRQYYAAFGHSVAMSPDGSIIACGSPYTDGPGYTDDGAVFVFNKISGVWSQKQKIKSSNQANYATFGYSIGLSNSGLLVAAPEINSGMGEVYHYSLAVNGVPKGVIKTNSLGQLDTSFLQYNLNLGGNILSGLLPPSANSDATNKMYVDGQITNVNNNINSTNNNLNNLTNTVSGHTTRLNSLTLASGLNDVSASGASAGDLLRYNGSAWKLDTPLAARIAGQGTGTLWNHKAVWKFDESSGDALDSAGSNHMQFYGSGLTYGVTGATASGTAASFNGNGYFKSANTFNGWKNPSTDFSVSVWFKTQQSWGTLWRFANENGNNGPELQIQNGNLFVYNWPNQHIYSSGVNVSDNNWHHAVVTWGNSGTKLYIDGQLNQTLSSTYTNGELNYYNFKMWAGFYYNGSLDKLAIFNNQISDTDVAAIYSTLDVEYVPGGNYRTIKTTSDGYIDDSFITSNIARSADLATEATARQSADATLQGNIDAEATARQAAIGQEAMDRTAADGLLQSAIDAEQTARETADTNLQNQINSILSNTDPATIDSFTEVVAAFQAADNSLNGAITTLANSASSALADEVAARQAADALKVSKSGDTMTGVLNFDSSSPEIDFKVNGTRKMVFGYDSNVHRGIFYSDAAAKGVFFFDSGTISIGSNPNAVSGNLLHVGSGVSISSNLDMESHKVVGVSAPSADTDAANKKYVDDAVSSEATARSTAVSDLDTRLQAVEAVAVEFYKEKFVITATDISNGYIELARVAVQSSINGFVDRLAIHETDDYTVSVVNGKTRITFVGNLVEPSEEKLAAGDVLRISYASLAI